MEKESAAGNRTAYLIATGNSVRIADDTPSQPITLHAVGDPQPKRRGEATEAEFIARAAGFDFRIAKPWGESDSYDVLVGIGHGFWRVQVKRAPYLATDNTSPTPKATAVSTPRTTSTSSPPI